MGLNVTLALFVGVESKSSDRSASSLLRIVPERVDRRRTGLLGFGGAVGSYGRATGMRDTMGKHTTRRRPRNAYGDKKMRCIYNIRYHIVRNERQVGDGNGDAAKSRALWCCTRPHHEFHDKNYLVPQPGARASSGNEARDRDAIGIGGGMSCLPKWHSQL